MSDMAETSASNAVKDRSPPKGGGRGFWPARGPLRFTLVLSVALIISALIYSVSLSVFERQAEGQATGRLQLLRATIDAEVKRFEHLPYVLARDRAVQEAVLGNNPGAINTRLADFADRAGLEAIYVMAPDGETIAASNYDKPASFIGQNYRFRPYFRQALAGDVSTFFGVGATTGRPGYFVAAPIAPTTDDAAATRAVGVVAVKLSLEKLETAWRLAGDGVLVTNADGVVLLASNPAWHYRVIAPLGDQALQRIRAQRQFADAPLEAVGDAPKIGDYPASWLSAPLHGSWTLHFRPDVVGNQQRALLVLALAAALAALVMWFIQRRRHTTTRAALGRSVANEAALRDINTRLANEIEDRKQAERALRRTQQELERASRLAALGKLAASVSHELGQPIAAMRNRILSAQLRAEKEGQIPALDRTLSSLNGLTDRMEGITRQLKFFAVSDLHSPKLETVDLVDAVDQSVRLISHELEARSISLDHTDKPNQALIHGNRLRLEQALTNILKNAVDAINDAPDGAGTRKLQLIWSQSDNRIALVIKDSGTGVEGRSLDDICEPFHTTKASGTGMGLGLSIVREIVTEHDGDLTMTSDQAGTAFTLSLPLHATDGLNP